MKKKIIPLLILALTVGMISAPIGMEIYADSVKVQRPATIHVKRISNTSLQVKWKKVAGVKGYVLYKQNAKTKKYKKIKTIKRSTKTKYVDKKLTPNKKYTYKVRAYKKVNGKLKYSKFTYKVSAIPYTKNAKKLNAGKIKRKARIVKIGLGEKKKLKGKVLPAKYGTAKGKKVVDKTVRTILKNTTYIKKDNKGRIVGKKAGITSAYLVAHNGNMKKVKVKVVDYAKPKKWTNLNEVSLEAKDVLTTHKKDLTEIASFFSQNTKYGTTEIYIDENDALVIDPKRNLGPMKERIEKFLRDNSEITINIYSKIIQFRIAVIYGDNDMSFQDITYLYVNDYDDIAASANRFTRIAPHWMYREWAPV